MTTETNETNETTVLPAGLSRRSFLSVMGAAGIVVSGVVGVSAVGAATAAAAAGSNVEWHITSEPADARTGYAALLNGIRQGISARRVRPEGGRPVDVTDENGTTQFIAVDLYTEGGGEFLRVFMRRSDAYVMGWRPGTDNGNGNVDWRNFFTLEPGVDLPGAIRTGTGANVNTRFEGLSNYTDLQRQGASRDNMQLTPSSLSNAVLTLHDGITPNVLVRLAAPAILQVIVGVAEASRFRNQAAQTAAAWGVGQPFALTPTHIAHHNSWALLSVALMGAIAAANVVLSPEIQVGEVIYASSLAIAAAVMMAHHSAKDTKGKGLLEASTKLVAGDGTGDFWTVQDAINALPSSGANTVFIDKGAYNEVITVPANRPFLTLQGVSGNPEDVVITNNRAHGLLKPDGTQWGTEGSATATFKAPSLTVRDLTISNTFNPANHPEVNAFETQAVAVAAKGDRQFFFNCRITARQDTLLVKAPTPTDQCRSYFANCFIQGSVDFIFGNATAVIDRCNVQLDNWVGGTVLAPNTDRRQKYGILLVGCDVFTPNVPPNTMYLGRPWHNTVDAWPQAVVRECEIRSGITAAHPWTDMMPDYSWSQARFKEYRNDGPGAGFGSNAPQMTDSEATEYTAEKYLAGNDGWNPIW